MHQRIRNPSPSLPFQGRRLHSKHHPSSPARTTYSDDQAVCFQPLLFPLIHSSPVGWMCPALNLPLFSQGTWNKIQALYTGPPLCIGPLPASPGSVTLAGLWTLSSRSSVLPEGLCASFHCLETSSSSIRCFQAQQPPPQRGLSSFIVFLTPTSMGN